MIRLALLSLDMVTPSLSYKTANPTKRKIEIGRERDDVYVYVCILEKERVGDTHTHRKREKDNFEN